MKFVHFMVDKVIHLGLKTERGILDISQYSMEDIIKNSDRMLEQLKQLDLKQAPVILEEQIIYAPCLIHPEKILCVGLNYLSHREETAMVGLDFPVLFSKFNNALAAHQQSIQLPQLAQKVDYEAELVVVIGREAVDVPKEKALEYVFGYTIGNDVSARDLQMRTNQWLLGKTCNHFAPIGPYLVTADEVNPNELAIQCTVNGEIRQSANTSEMIFDCATLISYISSYMTLKPGDLIFTGTPSGVVLGSPEEQQIWLKSGDEVAISIEKLGTLVNRFE